jgi:hypothetical protein
MALDTSILLARDRGGNMVIPASIGQQVFVISTGVAGGLAGFVLAARLTNATHLRLTPLLIASALASAASFAVVYMISAGDPAP